MVDTCIHYTIHALASMMVTDTHLDMALLVSLIEGCVQWQRLPNCDRWGMRVVAEEQVSCLSQVLLLHYVVGLLNGSAEAAGQVRA